jgi:hypothetical protein
MLAPIRTFSPPGLAVEVESEAAAEIVGVDREVDRPADRRTGPPQEESTDASLVLDRFAETVTECKKLGRSIGPA